MLTVEELVIESLYHRLVLINVKKLNASSPSTDGDRSVGEEVDDEVPVSPSSPVAAPAGLSATGTGGGLGFLVMNSLCPKIRRAYGMTPTFSLTLNAEQESRTGEKPVISAQSSIAEEFIAEHGFEVTEEVEMILSTNEIQLMKTTLRSPELQVEMPPTWHFGSSLSYDMNSVSPDTDDNTKVLMPRGISLDSCSQFSIVKLEDKRDPTGHSLVLVQTSEGDQSGPGCISSAGEHGALASCASALRKAKSLSEAETSDGSRKRLVKQKTSMVVPVPTPVLTTNKMSVFVQQGIDLGEEDQLEVEDLQAMSVLSTDSENVKARVLDLIQDLETTVSPKTSPVKSVSNGGEVENGPQDQLVIKEHQKEALCGVEDKPFLMTGSYKMFNITGNTECVLTSLEPPTDGENADKAGKDCPDMVSSILGEAAVVKPLTKPVAEIQFSVEAGETQLEETISAIKDIKCQFNSSIPTSLLGIVRQHSPTKSCDQSELADRVSPVSNSVMNGLNSGNSKMESQAVEPTVNVKEREDVLLNGFNVAGEMRQTDETDQVKSLRGRPETLSMQNGDVTLRGQLSKLNYPRPSSYACAVDDSKRSDEFTRELSSPFTHLPRQNRHSTHEFSCDDYQGSMGQTSRKSSCQELPTSPPPDWKRGKLPGDVSMESMYYTPPESPDKEMRFGRARSPPLLNSNEKPGGSPRQNPEQYTRRFCSSPRRRDNDSGLSLALQPPSRIVTYRDPASPMDSHSDLSDSFAFTESSEGDELASLCELDLPYDIPPYMRHPDWMSDLPHSVYSKPLTELIIPGSHISLAIDREMRMDMDFSKCNYEMAEFLRKLPNLAIFNSFRGLMKKIWKAWMPKQTLTVAQQLDAGVRYLDLRVTKLRGSLYGEHGLYTRPLKRYLKEIKEFLDEHSKEVVVLHFQTLEQLQMSDKRHLVTALFQTFGARLARVGIPGKTTLESMWKNKKQVIIIFPDEDMSSLRNHIFYGLVWSDFEIVAPYPNNLSIDELKTYLGMMDGDASPLKLAALDDKFHVVKAVLSPDMTMVFGEFKHKSMREMTENETESVVMDWIRENPKRKLNIVALDFVGTGSAVSNILQLNFPGCETVV